MSILLFHKYASRTCIGIFTIVLLSCSKTINPAQNAVNYYPIVPRTYNVYYLENDGTFDTNFVTSVTGLFNNQTYNQLNYVGANGFFTVFYVYSTPPVYWEARNTIDATTLGPTNPITANYFQEVLDTRIPLGGTYTNNNVGIYTLNDQSFIGTLTDTTTTILTNGVVSLPIVSGKYYGGTYKQVYATTVKISIVPGPGMQPPVAGDDYYELFTYYFAPNIGVIRFVQTMYPNTPAVSTTYTYDYVSTQKYPYLNQ
ncbi:MAG: hypothetical protein QM528_01510 [Phycisphaerales bacterium]|nr:hypothetical protein [Phycisphaerales bacterium]